MTASRCSGAILALVCLASTFALAHEPVLPKPPRDERPLIQIALLLDTSNSMDGLINQARTQLWTIVNEFARCKRDGRTPRLQVALYEYGNNNLAAGEGFIRMVLPLSEDLDQVSEKLHCLTTNGGDEYCGHVIQSAVNSLAWSSDAKVYKAIFIAGNEPFTQGSVDYRQSCSSAIGRGIVVNTIHCGDRSAGEGGKWADGARRGEGKFMNINQDRAVCVVPTPCDAEIERLSVELNVTYLPYGATGAASCARQMAQDDLAAAKPESGAAVSRGISKANALYRNEAWDLVDAAKEGKVQVETLEADKLPEQMRAMKPEERKQYVEQNAAKRAEIQNKINALNAERQKFLAQKQAEAGPGDTLDAAIVASVREQLREKEFEVE